LISKSIRGVLLALIGGCIPPKNINGNSGTGPETYANGMGGKISPPFIPYGRKRLIELAWLRDMYTKATCGRLVYKYVKNVNTCPMLDGNMKRAQTMVMALACLLVIMVVAEHYV